MNTQTDAWLRVELHLHTCASPDSLIQPNKLLDHCARIGIDRVAITDHNSIKGALAAQTLAPERVIVGEEIETTQGELLGYFMTEWIPGGLAPMKVIELLRAQGAVISVSHPFDTSRSQHWTTEQLEAIASHVDALEVFNARCLSKKPNQEAAAFACEHGLLETVGSDAHSLIEVGRATLRMPDFTDAEGFKNALIEANPATRLSSVFVHLLSRFAVVYRRVVGLSIM